MIKKIARIDYTKRFLKQLKKAPLFIQIKTKDHIDLFLRDSTISSLRDHPLSGNMHGYRSINITGDWRVIYSEHLTYHGNIIIFEMLGTHSQLYR